MANGIKNIRDKQKNIAIKFSKLNIGGIQSMIVSQCEILLKSGHNVILVFDEKIIDYELPDSVKVKILDGNLNEKLSKWQRFLKEENIDSYIDHNILYEQSWVKFSEVARELKVTSIGWVHNIFVRPILDFSNQNEFLIKNIDKLDKLIVLSEADANYYSLLGHKEVYFIPNPLSPMLKDNIIDNHKTHYKNDELEIIWAGRAHQSTKRILDLIPLMQEIVKEIPRAHLMVVGPFTWDINKVEFENLIKNAGLEKNISVIGPKSQKELLEYYKKADIAISTSVVEGFPITLIEENALGLPIVMYDLPWLWIAKNNKGIKVVPQGDFLSMSKSIVKIARSPKIYLEMSRAGVDKVSELKEIDFTEIYYQLINGRLPKKYSPNPRLGDVKNILYLINDYYVRVRNEKQNELEQVRANNISTQNTLDNIDKELSKFLSIRRSARLLLGNIKRNLIMATIVRSAAYKWYSKFNKKHKKIKVAVLVGEFFSTDLPYNNVKGGYGIIARNYLAEYIPNHRISIDTICGFNEGDELLIHVVDRRKKVLFLPANKSQNQQKISEIIDKYDIFLSIELQDIASQVISKASKNQKLIYYIQDPRPEEDWIELDSVKRFKAVGYRPNQQSRALMNKLYLENRLVAISQGKDFIEKARKLYDLPTSFDAKFIPNAVKIPQITDAEIESKENTIIALARLDIVKRPWIIGEVAKRLPEYNFVFAGQMHDEEMKEVMGPYMKLANVKNTGHIEQEEKDKLLRESKLLINTSIHECIPVSFLEALSYGVPIISNRNPDGITKKFGHAVKQVNGDGFEEVDDLVEGIKKFIENEDLRIRTAKRGIEYVKETHNIDSFVKDIRNVIIETYEA